MMRISTQSGQSLFCRVIKYYDAEEESNKIFSLLAVLLVRKNAH